MNVEIYNDNLDLICNLDLNYSHCNGYLDFKKDTLYIYIYSNIYSDCIQFDTINKEVLSVSEISKFEIYNLSNNKIYKKYNYTYYIKGFKLLRLNNLDGTTQTIRSTTINMIIFFIFCFIPISISIICKIKTGHWTFKKTFNVIDVSNDDEFKY